MVKFAVSLQPTFSRFGTKLSGRWIAVAVKDVLRNLTRRLYDTLPDFGKSVAIDSTDIKAWSNGAKHGKKPKPRKDGKPKKKRQKPRIGKSHREASLAKQEGMLPDGSYV